MQTHEIDHIARTHQLHNFCGVFPSDRIPTAPPPHGNGAFCFICNTDPASMPGTHWLAFNFLTPTLYEFYDSYGLPLHRAYPQLIRAAPLIRNAACAFSAPFACQSVDSDLCGQYSLYYLHRRLAAHQRPMKIYSVFKPHMPAQNDCVVNSFACQTLSYCFGKDYCQLAPLSTTNCAQSCKCFKNW